MTKNILWLPSWYPNALSPYEGDFIQRHARAVAKFQKITIIYVRKDGEGTLTKDVKVEVSVQDNLREEIVYYHSLQTGFRLLNRLLSYLKYKRIYREAVKRYMEENGRPDLVHVHVAIKAGLQAMQLKKNEGIPYIVTEHWTGYHKAAKVNMYNSGLFFRHNTAKVLKNASLLLPVSRNLGEVINSAISAMPFEVTGNVVDTDLFFYKNSGKEKFRFIHASSLNYQKNPEGILRAAKQLADKGYHFEVEIIGWLTQPLIGMADSLSLTGKYVFFKSPVPYARVAIEMQQASALLVFSRIENMPCIITEALCCGLPVISSNVGGIGEVINENNGILVESGNEDQLTQAMEKMIMNYGNYNRQEISGKAMHAFSYDSIGRKIVEIYHRVSTRPD